jgi:hypothetical protein
MRRVRPALAVGAAGVVALALAWVAIAPDRPPACGPLEHDSRPLDLDRPGDRAHLDDDLQLIRQSAERFSELVARRPLLSDSPDALRGARLAPARARAWCERILADEVARSHALGTNVVRPALGPSAEPPVSDPFREGELRTVEDEPDDREDHKAQKRHPRE